MTFSLRPAFAQIPYVKLSYNIGGLFDVPTGTYVFGRHNEAILNGGLGPITGVVGIGNQFKSTIMHDMMLIAMARMAESTGNTYDTEINILESRLRALGVALPDFKGEDVIDNGRWTITDKSIYFGNEWYEILKEFLKEKEKEVNAKSKAIMRETPFIDRDGSLMKIAIPTFTEIDSFSQFETQDVANMQAANELGDSGANTMFMRQGIAKTRFLTDIPKMIAKANNPMLMTAHIGKGIPMDAKAPPEKKLQFLKNGDKMKGVTDMFTFLTTNCFHCQNAAPMFNDGTKGPEYPRDSDDNLKFDTDLFLVTLVTLRSKTGPSGMLMQVIVSQQEGLQPSLTEFHYLKTMDRYGFGGNLQNYWLELIPEVKLSRTAVRGKINKDAKLRRALNIMAEMCQMEMLWHDKETKDLACTPKQLYDDLKAKGYDWDQLLDTRGWWTFNNDEPVERIDGAQQYFLSTRDLLRMRKGLYHPWWMPKPAGLVLEENNPHSVTKTDVGLGLSDPKTGLEVVSSLDDFAIDLPTDQHGKALSVKKIVKKLVAA